MYNPYPNYSADAENQPGGFYGENLSGNYFGDAENQPGGFYGDQ
jgi:hypothetical protein